MSPKFQDSDYKSVLGLRREPFRPEPDPSFYFPLDSFEQRLHVLDHMVQGAEVLVLIIGEPGSGKTTFLQRYLATSDVKWQAGRIQTEASPASVSNGRQEPPGGYPAFTLGDAENPIVIVDDAHRLSRNELKFLLWKAVVPGTARKIRRLVLCGDSLLNAMVTALSDSSAGEIAINKITMPPLTRVETDAYLQYRLAIAGYKGEHFLRPSAIKKIHRKTGGIAGRINERADQWLKRKYSHQPPWEAMLKLLKGVPLMKVAGWGVAGIVAIIVALTVFNQFRLAPEKPYEDQKPADHVFRAKVPAVAVPRTPPPLVPLTETPEAAAPETAIEKDSLQPRPTQPPALAKLETPQLKPSEIGPPEIAPDAQKKEAAAKTIYREDWLLDQNPSFYTLQILGVRNERSLLSFVTENKLLQKEDVAYYKTVYKGQDWYPLLYGVYPTVGDARSAVKELPDKIRASTPWIRKMAAIQKTIQAKGQP